MTLVAGQQLPILEAYNTARFLARDGRINEHHKVNIVSGNVIAEQHCCGDAVGCWPLIQQAETLECRTLVGDIQVKVVKPFLDKDGNSVAVEFRLGIADELGYMINPEFLLANGEVDLTTEGAYLLKEGTGQFTTKPVMVVVQLETPAGVDRPVTGEFHWFMDIRTTQEDEPRPS